MTIRHLSSLVAAVLLVSCANGPIPPDPAHRAELEDWRAARMERLTAEDGWLTLVGLEWLEPGANRVGAAADADVRLPEGTAPEEVGVIELADDGSLAFRTAPDADVTVDGEEVDEAPLTTDADGAPTELRVGRLLFYPIARGDRIGIRVKDPEAAARTAFDGIESFPIDMRYLVEATLEEYAEPEAITMATVAGTDAEALVPGVLRFRLLGRDLALKPTVSSPDDRRLFIVFADETSGVTTYGACRFLSAERPVDGATTLLDFNYAYNPPCAFTPYATCPLPPEGNRLPVAVEAGERHSGAVH